MLRSLITRHSKTLSNGFARVIGARAGSTAAPSDPNLPPETEYASASSMGVIEPNQEYADAVIQVLNEDICSGYDIRFLLSDLQAMDYIPESNLIKAFMVACRRENDYALAIRILESVKWKCGQDAALFNQLLQPIQSTLDDLGILTPAQMGYDKPEFYYEDVFDLKPEQCK